MIGAFAHLDHILAANGDQARYLVEHLEVDRRRVSVVPAFLPPAPVREDAFDALPRPLIEFCARFCSLAIVTGFARPYYGLHTAIEAAGTMKNALGLVVHIYTSGDGSYIQRIRRLAAAQSNVYISESDLADELMTALLMRARIFIRATSVDGDSVALREAAFLGRQIVATNCAPRPAGCMLYPFGDQVALAARLEEAIRNPEAGRTLDCRLDGGVRILAIYRSVSAAQIAAAADEARRGAGR
jgi:glycosyltransferase involved in cell wall biosynthesis